MHSYNSEHRLNIYSTLNFSFAFKNFLNYVVAILLLATSLSARANIVVSLPETILGEEPCNQLAGSWTGYGQVSAIGIVKCKYSGKLEVKKGSVNQFDMQVILDRQTGICPAHEELTLGALCQSGVITVNSEDANLKGTLSSDGRSGNITGNVMFALLGKKITAHVDEMHINKK